MGNGIPRYQLGSHAGFCRYQIKIYLAIGVVWEELEFALGGVVVTVYGIDDIVTNFVFNAVGAVIVAIWGTGSVGTFVGFFRRLRSGLEN